MKPTRDQLHQAAEAAERLRESGEDADFLAKSLLYLKHRNEHLEQVFEIAERYVKFGMDEGEHKRLVKAIDEARAAEWEETGEADENLGLTSSP